ncbi:MAG: 30S ribosomal protein S7 [Syntrophales bacterium]|nr:30S ribosomal protein S7 [Syntrophales bacterium]MDD5233540.1 30S ribosomal protein S7 [Syntrophales bacterium]MDD5531739.1 30S ribosomal protein S7 [Syntrophales bacterium]
MPRRRDIQKREILPDPVHNSRLVAKFINNLILKGKKSTAESILYGAFEVIARKTKESPTQVFEKAVDNVKPVIEVKSRRVGGSTYQVPTEILPDRRLALGIKWIIGNSRKRAEKTMREKLAGELIDAANNRGASVKKREDVHKMAEANRAFAHYRF